jgi:integrase
MGLYKLCDHKKRARDRCGDAWWGSFNHQGKSYRASLSRWGNQEIRSKAEAEAVLDRMREAIREGKFASKPAPGPLTFDDFGDLYTKRCVELRGLRSRSTIKYRMRLLRARFGKRQLAEIHVADVEDMVRDLKAAGKKPATVNRHLALLRAMLNWAVEREYLDKTPFRKGSQALIKLERENNQRSRRLSSDEEKALLAKAKGNVRALIVAALDTGMRRGELLSLRFGDVDLVKGVIHVRAENAKSKRGRSIPIATGRLTAVFKWLQLDSAGNQKPDDAAVFSRHCGKPLKDFRDAWVEARKGTAGEDLRFHDLRGEYASRLVERGVPLSQVRDLLGHASIVTTERYDRQKFEMLELAAKKLETGEVFNISSSSDEPQLVQTSPADTISVEKSLPIH